MNKKAMIAILAVLVGLILVTMSVPLSQAIVPPRGDYSDTVGVEYTQGRMTLAFDVPAKDATAFRFGLVGGQYSFVDGDDEASKMLGIIFSTGKDGRVFLDDITGWIHDCIAYESDGDGWYSDHWQLPGETLRKGTGDCEDMAILGASIAEAAGYDTVLVFGEDHAVFAMECDPLNIDYTVEYKGRTYVTADPTCDRVGWPIDAECITDTIWTPFNIAFVSVQAFGVILGAIAMIYAWRRME